MPSNTRGQHHERSSKEQEGEEGILGASQPKVAENKLAGWQGSSGRSGVSSPGLHLSCSTL